MEKAKLISAETKDGVFTAKWEIPDGCTVKRSAIGGDDNSYLMYSYEGDFPHTYVIVELEPLKYGVKYEADGVNGFEFFLFERPLGQLDLLIYRSKGVRTWTQSPFEDRKGLSEFFGTNDFKEIK